MASGPVSGIDPAPWGTMRAKAGLPCAKPVQKLPAPPESSCR